MINSFKKILLTIITSLIFIVFPFILNAIIIKDASVMDNIEGLKHSIVIITKNGVEYISITDFVYIFDGYLEKGDLFTKAIFKDKNKEVTFNHGSKEIFIDKEKIYLKTPTIIIKKKLYVPFDFVKEKWGKVLNIDIKWEEKQAILILNAMKEKKIEEKKEVAKEITKEAKDVEDKAIEEIIKKKEVAKEITKEEKIYREKESIFSRSKEYNKPSKIYKIKTIVLDPGHGGKDPGAVGPTGVKEKNINLDIARRVKELIEAKSDIKVILTRYYDEFVPLGRRSDIANMNRSDLFISIHINASFSRAAEGFEVYYLSAQASDSRARAVAILENGVIELERDTKLKDYGYTELILADMAQNQFIEESVELAGILQEMVSRRLRIKTRGIKSAPFYVLKGVTMPAILVEVAFISNPKEEREVEQDYFKDCTAQCICEAILEYAKRYEDSLGFTR